MLVMFVMAPYEKSPLHFLGAYFSSKMKFHLRMGYHCSPIPYLWGEWQMAKVVMGPPAQEELLKKMSMECVMTSS